VRPFRGQLVLLVLVVLLLVAGAAGVLGLGGPPAPTASRAPGATDTAAASPATQPTPTGAGLAPTLSPLPMASPPTSPPQATPSPAPTPAPRRSVPLVPVVGFWTGTTSISSAQLERALSGADGEFSQVVVPAGMADAVRAGRPGATVTERDEAGLLGALDNGALGLVPLPMVDHRFRALALDDVSLFGNVRVASLDDWPLEVTIELAEFDWEQADTWTLVAAGDILLDRGVARQTTVLDKGPDFPWDGGTVAIQRRRCCTVFGWPYPISRRTGNEGALRELFAEADLAMANLESAVFPGATYHTTGFTFTGEPRLLRGLTNAGVDFVTLANNHIGNGGRQGILRTMETLDERGIAHAGAGADVAAASRATILDVGGQRVAIISCTAIGGFRAGTDRIGVHGCGRARTTDMVRQARAEADVVIVAPHWGREYRLEPAPNQRRLARAWIEAGADLVIGHHSHWAGAIEEIGDGLAFYSLGNFIFDQTWSENTMEGLVLELTFQRGRLVQAWLHPTLILDAAQPNLLEYDRGGRDVLDRVRDGSRGLFDY